MMIGTIQCDALFRQTKDEAENIHERFFFDPSPIEFTGDVILEFLNEIIDRIVLLRG